MTKFFSLYSRLSRLSPNYKQQVLKRFRYLFHDPDTWSSRYNLTEELKDKNQDLTKSLSLCYEALGKAAYHKELVSDINKLIWDGLYSDYTFAIQELVDLRKNFETQINLVTKLINTIMIERDKMEQANVPCSNNHSECP